MRKLFLILFILSVTACSSTNYTETKRFKNYAQTIPPITVPSGIKNPTEESYYPVPTNKITADAATMPPLMPPGSQKNAN